MHSSGRGRYGERFQHFDGRCEHVESKTAGLAVVVVVVAGGGGVVVVVV